MKMSNWVLPIEGLPLESPKYPREGNAKGRQDTKGTVQYYYTMVWTGRYDYKIIDPEKYRCIGTGIHAGVDIVFPQGTDVKAISSGKVVHAKFSGNKKKDTGWGYLVTIEHSISNNLKVYSHYGHLKENSISVKKNDDVKAGDKIGEVGNTGGPPNKDMGVHLHFQIDRCKDKPYVAQGYGEDIYINDTNIKKVKENTRNPIKFILDRMNIISYPINPDNDQLTDINGDKSEKLYAIAESSNLYNYYPITIHGQWHNGIHLSPPESIKKIYAISGGKVIYSSLSRDDEGYGSPNFLLIKHEQEINSKQVKYYSLYMHIEKFDYPIELDENDSKKLPDWILRYFYEEKETEKSKIIDVYSDGTVSVLEKEDPNSNHIAELVIGDTFTILEKNKNKTTMKIEGNKDGKDYTGWIYFKNKIKRFKQYKMHPSIKGNKKIFISPYFYKNPPVVNTGEFIAKTGPGVEFVEMSPNRKESNLPENMLHLEIFSREQDNNGKNIFEYLNDGSFKFTSLQSSKNNSNFDPLNEKKEIIQKLFKTDDNFKNFVNSNIPGTSNDTSSNLQPVIKPKELQNYLNTSLNTYRNCVTKHPSTWQMLYDKIKWLKEKGQEDAEKLRVFNLFNDQKVLEKNEPLFFYHPLRFIEFIHNATCNNEESLIDTSTPVVRKKDTPCITLLKEKDIVKNKKDVYFNPDDPINRIEFLKMLLKGLEYQIPSPDSVHVPFSDVQQKQWYSSYIFVANHCKIATGYGDTGKFGPFDNTTVKQVKKMTSIAKYGYGSPNIKNNDDIYDVFESKNDDETVSRSEAAEVICQLIKENESTEHISKRKDSSVKKVQGPKQADPGDKINYKVTELKEVNAEKSINWMIKNEDTEEVIEQKQNCGASLEYTIDVNTDLMTIRVMPYTDIPSLELSIITEIIDPETQKEIDALARTLYGEARGENEKSKRAVAWTIRNRTGKNKWWGHTFYEVTHKDKQYSCWNKGDPNYHKVHNPSGDSWEECKRIAREIYYDDPSNDPTNGATHYYDKSLDYNPPDWSDKNKIVNVEDVRNIRFFKGIS
jgi:murein DD-endopeptidase MepM/ murein hydrolase activator NlpD